MQPRRSRHSLATPKCSLRFAGLIAWITTSAGAAVLPPPDLEPSEPIHCSGQQDVTIVGRSIATSGHGIEVTGNCDLTLIDSHIVAGDTGVLVRSNGDVYIRNSFIQGASGALIVAGNGDVYYQGTTLRGGLREGGNGDLHDEGGNSVERIPGAVAGAGVGGLLSTGPMRCGAGERISIVGRQIESEDDGLVVEAGCEALVSDSHLIATGRALVVEDGGVVRVRNAVLDGAQAAIEVAADGRLHMAGTNLHGAVAGRGFADGGGNSPRDGAGYRPATAGRRSREASGGGGISIGRGGLRVEGAGGEGGDHGAGSVTIGAGGIRVEGAGRSGADAGSGGLEIGRRGLRIEGGGGGDADTEACRHVCQSWATVSDEVRACAFLVLTDRGHGIASEPICTAADTRLGCRACSLTLGLDAADCDAVIYDCFGG